MTGTGGGPNKGRGGGGVLKGAGRGQGWGGGGLWTGRGMEAGPNVRGLGGTCLALMSASRDKRLPSSLLIN